MRMGRLMSLKPTHVVLQPRIIMLRSTGRRLRKVETVQTTGTHQTKGDSGQWAYYGRWMWLWYLKPRYSLRLASTIILPFARG